MSTPEHDAPGGPVGAGFDGPGGASDPWRAPGTRPPSTPYGGPADAGRYAAQAPYAEPTSFAAPTPYTGPTAAPYGPPPPGPYAAPWQEPRRRPSMSTRKRLLLVVGAVLLVAVVAVGGLFALGAALGAPAGLDSEAPAGYGEDPALDRLWDRCESGDGAACDDLFWDSPVGSRYEEFGDTCGERFTDGPWSCKESI
ncbi:hypothetical protein PU560_05495 [Georgenia sp. 10Sc9-8]|uniref:Uncharacterized protein n=1 Tax=Georgenia halotolerans TaxID=3028317 RepID=A0ABT5TV31_9MICO|nr:hypothetical protein [Georgenia halotolerans]